MSALSSLEGFCELDITFRTPSAEAARDVNIIALPVCFPILEPSPKYSDSKLLTRLLPKIDNDFLNSLPFQNLKVATLKYSSQGFWKASATPVAAHRYDEIFCASFDFTTISLIRGFAS